MRLTGILTCSVLFATSGCLVDADRDNDPSTDQTTSDLRATPEVTSFVLTVRPGGPSTQGADLTSSDGGHNLCHPGPCNFAYVAGVSVTISPVQLVDTINCRQWDHWLGACAGQGSTCHLTISGNASVTGVVSTLQGCTPR